MAALERDLEGRRRELAAALERAGAAEAEAAALRAVERELAEVSLRPLCPFASFLAGGAYAC